MGFVTWQNPRHTRGIRWIFVNGWMGAWANELKSKTGISGYGLPSEDGVCGSLQCGVFPVGHGASLGPATRSLTPAKKTFPRQSQPHLAFGDAKVTALPAINP